MTILPDSGISPFSIYNRTPLNSHNNKIVNPSEKSRSTKFFFRSVL